MVSVIIPIYKVEKYLDRCVESVVNQTYKDLEIILVDDGSPDNCPTMCEEWAKKDERIKVIHKVNGGLSSARNAGLDICTGDYIMFLDSDDWYDLTTIELCLLDIIEHESDIVEFGIRGINDCGVQDDIVFYDRNASSEILKRFCLNGDSVCNKMYKKFIWQSLRFKDGLIFEDAYIFADVYSVTTKVSYLHKNLYNQYRSNEESIMHKVTNNPKEPWYRWKYESHIIEKLSYKLDSDLLNMMKVRAIEHALKAYIINISTVHLSAEEGTLLNQYIFEQSKQIFLPKIEYRLYLYSYNHFNILNRIKSLEFMWRYRNWK